MFGWATAKEKETVGAAIAGKRDEMYAADILDFFFGLISMTRSTGGFNVEQRSPDQFWRDNLGEDCAIGQDISQESC